MKGTLSVLVFILLAMLCWGVYGPVLEQGRIGMEGSSLRPFICVGLAYFGIAVVVPLLLLRVVKEKGQWTTPGIVWSLVAGAAGAIGALGIILAFAFRGSPIYVMPLVFGCAPVVNTFLTMYWSRSFGRVSPVFIAGLILVVCGAVTVLLFRPHLHAAEHVTVDNTKDGISLAVTKEAGGVETTETFTAADAEELKTKYPDRPELVTFYKKYSPLSFPEISMVFLFTAMTALAWGVYGPTLHRGQSAMGGSRLRPLLCVGLAYFLIAVLVPVGILNSLWQEPGQFTQEGTVWSLAGGAAGAIGALGIIMAFNFGGKPIYVMPIVFGGAPVVNTFVSLMKTQTVESISPMFYAGLILAAVGAVTVLVFAPRSHGPAPAPEAPPASPEPAAEQPAGTPLT